MRTSHFASGALTTAIPISRTRFNSRMEFSVSVLLRRIIRIFPISFLMLVGPGQLSRVTCLPVASLRANVLHHLHRQYPFTGALSGVCYFSNVFPLSFGANRLRDGHTGHPGGLATYGTPKIYPLQSKDCRSASTRFRYLRSPVQFSSGHPECSDMCTMRLE